MRPAVLLLVVVTAASACRPVSAPRPPAPPTPLAIGVIAFERVGVVRMDRDAVLPDQTVIVSDGRIQHVGPGGSTIIPHGAYRIDGRGQFLMPALADMQVQLSPNSWRLRRELALYAAHGVALVRNLDGRSAHLRWRERVRHGELVAPTILTCGPPIASDTSLFGRSDDVLGNRVAALGTSVERMLRDRRTVASIRPEIMEQRRRGYDCVSVDSPSDWTPARYDALVAAARATGMPVVGAFARNLPLEDNLRGRTTADEVASFLAHRSDGETAANTDAARDSIVRDLAPKLRSFGVAMSTKLGGASAGERSLLRRLVDVVAERGGRLLLATGASLRSHIVPGASAHWELRELVAAGLTPFQALQTATSNPALVLGAPGDFGLVVPGARADLLLLDGNPLADVANTERLAGVMIRGRWLPRSELRRMREEATAPRRRLRRFW